MEHNVPGWLGTTACLLAISVTACQGPSPTAAERESFDIARVGETMFGRAPELPAPSPASLAGGHKASGTFAPAGPPLAPPVRVDAGGHCIIDLQQAYSISGTLSGALEVDFRILTYGPCPAGPPVPGTFDEVWIARGTFAGTFDGATTTATLSYTASIRSGGDVKGTITFAGGLSGTLRVRGNFADGALSYNGRVSNGSGAQ